MEYSLKDVAGRIKDLREAKGYTQKELAKKINSAIFPGTQGGPLMHTIAGKAVCFGEALKPEFKDYGKRVVENAKALADGLLKRGFNLVSGGTDNHLMLVDLTPFELTGKATEKLLDAAHITCNKNTIPNDPKSPFVTSGVRLGTAAVSTRGFKVDIYERHEKLGGLLRYGIPEFRLEKEVLDKLDNLYGANFDCGIDKVGEMIDKAIASGATNVDNLSFSLSLMG